MVMGEESVVSADRGDYVTLHDLHVVDVVEQLEVFGSNLLAELNSPCGLVAHVVAVVYPAIEQFHHKHNASFFTQGHQSF